MLRSTFAVTLAAFLLAGVPAAVSAPDAARPGSDASPKISPSGRWIVFERYFPPGSRYSQPIRSLRIVDADGTSERQLIPPTTEILLAGWTADNFVRITHGRETVLVNPEDARVVGPALPASASSPDGRRIAYTLGARELWVSSPDGSRARLVASAPNWIATGAFSPDSTRLSYAAGLGISSSASEIVGVDGTGRVRLHEAPVVGAGIWAPDGRSVVFVAQNDRIRYRPPGVYVAKADGSNLRRLIPGFAFAPDWSPRGDWILFQRQVRTLGEDRYYLMLVRPDGSDVHRVRQGTSATWLADGRRAISAGSGACRRSGILEIDIFRGAVKRLTNRCRIAGTRGADNLRGTSLRDILHGLGGDDRIAGRGGNDDLFGGPGDDSLLARDGRTDHLDCGPGRDSVVADRTDLVSRSCERVSRR